MNHFNAPKLRKDFIIIVHRDRPELAAAALSHLYQAETYLPIFSCLNVAVAADSPILDPDVYAIQRRRAQEFCVFVGNAIIENGGCENLIFLGLTSEQKSYMIALQKHYNVLEIDDYADIPAYLGGFSVDKGGGTLECALAQYPQGILHAIKNKSILQIGAHNDTLHDASLYTAEGLIVAEKSGKVEELIAINYSLSINADLLLVEELDRSEKEDVLFLLEQWQLGDATGLVKVKDKITSRLGATDFSKYRYATFFTDGLPYALCVRDVPTSMVNLEYRPDFFVFNNIVSEGREGLGSAAIFSPGFFDPDEEVDIFLPLFEHYNFYLRSMRGKGASVYNLRNTIELYPMDYLHICSHGGTVKGTLCTVKFHDDHGAEHIVEFEHVLNIGITPYLDKHLVESIYYFKKLNGFIWRSAELRAQNYPNELYASLEQKISNAFTARKVKTISEVGSVYNTNSIVCDFHNYNANFDQFGAPDIHPVIFNNSCWSWMTISDKFLVAGARGYIGTLREVNNDQAVSFAKDFYAKIFNCTLLEAFFHASQAFLNANPETLYIYWGLHFSTLKNSNAVLSNKHKVETRIKDSLVSWLRKKFSRQGSANLLTAKVLDTKWITRNVAEGNDNGHFLIK